MHGGRSGSRTDHRQRLPVLLRAGDRGPGRCPNLNSGGLLLERSSDPKDYQELEPKGLRCLEVPSSGIDEDPEFPRTS